MRVEVSVDCGATYTVVWAKDGLDLSTLGAYNTTDNWSPTSAADWRNEDIDMSAYQGETIIARFVNINGFGNSTLIDNVNLAGTLNVRDTNLEGIALYPNPTSDNLFVNFGNNQINNATIRVTNHLGQLVQAIDVTQKETVLDVSAFSTGLYFVTIESGNETTTKKLIVQ